MVGMECLLSLACDSRGVFGVLCLVLKAWGSYTCTAVRGYCKRIRVEDPPGALQLRGQRDHSARDGWEPVTLSPAPTQTNRNAMPLFSAPLKAEHNTSEQA